MATGARILVVNDFAGWRLKVRKMLHHSANIVGEACDGFEAIEKSVQLRPDIVILDLNRSRAIDGKFSCIDKLFPFDVLKTPSYVPWRESQSLLTEGLNSPT
jgi:DNA-binding NarL/FixJ family response regulator